MEQAYYRSMAQIQAAHWWYEGRRRILRSLIAKLPFPGRDILEVGCGTGANLQMLKYFGSAQGMEPNDYAREHAGKISGCTIKAGSLPRDIPYAGPFGLIGAFDVIEHIDDDAGSVAALRALLLPGGYAVFTVPAWRFLWSQHDVVNHHKRRYTKAEFAALLRRAGYEIPFISYYNFFLFPPVAVVRLLKNALKITDRPDTAMPPRPVNAVLKFVFASERFLLRFMPLPFGVSIVAVCRNPS